MLKEFALEPAVLGDWQEFRCLNDKFGSQRARMIAEFPKKWRKRVFEATMHFTDGQRKEIELWLIKGRKLFLVPNSLSNRQDIQTDWLQNAEAAHSQKPFHAIIAKSNPRNHPKVISSGLLYEQNPLFQCPHECFMPRNPAGYVEVSRNLLQWSETIIFVDPLFTSFKRWMEPLKAMLYCVSPNAQKISYCIRLDDNDLKGRLKELESLPEAIPRRMSLEVVILEKSPSEDTHNRFILTELGGLKFPWGLDAGESGSKDTVNLMAEATHQMKFAEYSEPELFGHSVAMRFEVKGTVAPL